RLDGGDVGGERLLVQQVALLRPAARVADHPRRPAGEGDRPVPGVLEPPQDQQPDEVADVQAGRRRVAAEVERDRAGGQPLGQRRTVGRLLHQAARLEVVQDRRVGRHADMVPAPRGASQPGTAAPNRTPAAVLGDAGAVTTEAAPPTDEATDGSPAEREGRRWGLGRLAVLGAVAGLVVMWGYVVYLAVGPGRQPPIDRLEDPAFAEAAEARCAAAVEAVDELPVAAAVDTAEERAEVLDEANDIFEDMLDDLEGMLDLVPAGEQRERAEAWLSDWRTYLGDRRAYAEALRVDPEARLLVSEKEGEGRHVTGWIDE